MEVAYNDQGIILPHCNLNYLCKTFFVLVIVTGDVQFILGCTLMGVHVIQLSWSHSIQKTINKHQAHYLGMCALLQW